MKPKSEETTSLYDNLSKESLASLLHVGRVLNSSLDLGRVLELAMDVVRDALRSEASSLLLVDEPSNRLFFKTATGKKAREVKRFTLDMGQGIVGWVVQNKKPYLCRDVNEDPRWFRDISQAIEFPTRSILCVPLKVKDRIIGAVEVINKEGEDAFGEEDMILLSALADQTAMALENARLHTELDRDAQGLVESLRKDIVGTGPVMERVFALIRKVSQTDSTVLVRGASGTGKELVARSIHYSSPRKSKPFVCVNCSVYSATLLESELFGHEKGAFTGAVGRKMGRFEMADRGTIFLDEIGTLSPDTQVKLLRFLQEREFERVGGTEPIRVDVRIVAATNENLEEAIREGRFRDDLYYRLKVIEIGIPPLRERKEDIPDLLAHFLRLYSFEVGRTVDKVDKTALKLLMAYDWPGNVRELKNTIERAVVLGSGDTILSSHLPQEIQVVRGVARTGDALKDAEANHIERILRRTDWNKSQAARLLEISRNRLDRKIKEYALAP